MAEENIKATDIAQGSTHTMLGNHNLSGISGNIGEQSPIEASTVDGRHIDPADMEGLVIADEQPT